jgi:hypothetical protein
LFRSLNHALQANHVLTVGGATEENPIHYFTSIPAENGAKMEHFRGSPVAIKGVRGIIADPKRSLRDSGREIDARAAVAS